MTSQAKLDQELLEKIALKRDKSKRYIRQQISKRATRLGIASEAAQILMAREVGIGTSRALRKLEPHVQEQVRENLPLLIPEPSAKSTSKSSSTVRGKDPFLAAIDFLILDSELMSRCRDLLKSKKHFDRVLREATTVLEDRIKSKAEITTSIRPMTLVNRALNPNLDRAILIISDEPSEQEGFHSLCKGIVLAFRHEAHHNLDDDVTREDALKFCAFIDVLLGMLERARLRVEAGISG